jgi:hypothetical protein
VFGRREIIVEPVWDWRDLRWRWNRHGNVVACEYGDMRRGLWQCCFVRRYLGVSAVTERHLWGRNSAGLGRDQQRRRQPTNSRSGTKFFYADNKWSSFANCRNWHFVRDNRLIHACNWLLKWQPGGESICGEKSSFYWLG